MVIVTDKAVWYGVCVCVCVIPEHHQCSSHKSLKYLDKDEGEGTNWMMFAPHDALESQNLLEGKFIHL